MSGVTGFIWMTV